MRWRPWRRRSSPSDKVAAAQQMIRRLMTTSFEEGRVQRSTSWWKWCRRRGRLGQWPHSSDGSSFAIQSAACVPARFSNVWASAPADEVLPLLLLLPLKTRSPAEKKGEENAGARARARDGRLGVGVDGENGHLPYLEAGELFLPLFPLRLVVCGQSMSRRWPTPFRSARYPTGRWPNKQETRVDRSPTRHN